MAPPSPPVAPVAPAVHRWHDGVRRVGPNWYAVVMGTAMVATAGEVLGDPPGVRPVRQGVWLLAVGALAVVVAARAAHWRRYPEVARAQLLDPAVAPFHGCAAMAPLAVGAATLAVGADVVGRGPAVAAAAVLWAVGTVAALVVAAGIPYLMIARHRIGVRDASPVWLLPVVAPMVSAATGPALAPWLPAGQWRASLLLGCGALFGVSLAAVLLLLPLIFARLLRFGPPPAASAPALFLVLGPLGQSATAAGQLADAAPRAARAGYLAVAYGVPVLGFALLWLVLAGALVLRSARGGLPFGLGWWAFTFPVGTCVTGTAALARHTGLPAPAWLAAGLYAVLVTAWTVVAARTVRGLANGTLLAPPGAAGGTGPVAGGPGAPRDRAAGGPGGARRPADAPGTAADRPAAPGDRSGPPEPAPVTAGVG
ncbi:C4-dicarboxylate ABC transporter [Streptomyces pactum]|uniref:C4-dicarboxylate ABC transporter n=1 Tax=Streptomyces pactum TaxID=68249 RepID=A0ABS0NFU6_9ACTN|nr:C4-dicarboxylate ABC transporter [Streptomyces pactum]